MKKRLIWFLFLLPSLGFPQPFTTINYSVSEGLPSSEVYQVYQDKDGFLWFATDNGVVRYDGYEMQVYNMEHGLSDPAVFGFHEDERGRLWFYTYSGKLSYYENGKIHNYKYNDQLTQMIPSAVINSIHYDSLDQLWFSTNAIWGRIDSTGNVYYEEVIDEVYYVEAGSGYLIGSRIRSASNKDKFIRINDKRFYRPELQHGGVLVCSARWRDKLYLSYRTEVYEYDGEFIRTVHTGPDKIINLSVDRHDNLWVGYERNGAARFDNADFKNPWYPDFLRNTSVTEVLEDHERGLWLTTLERGVFYIPNTLVANYPLPTTSKIFKVVASDHHVVIADRQGTVIALNNEDPESPVFTGLTKLKVTSLITDAQDNVWANGERSVARIDPNLAVKTFPKMYNTIPAIQFTTYESNFSDSILWARGTLVLMKYNLSGVIKEMKYTKFITRCMFVDSAAIYIGGRSGLYRYDHDFNFIDEIKGFEDFKVTNLLGLNDSILLAGTIGSGFTLLNKKTLERHQFSTKTNFTANYIYSVLKTNETLWLGTEKGIVRIPIQSLLSGNPRYHVMTKRSGLISDKIDHLTYLAPNVWAFSDEGFSVFSERIKLFSNEDPIFYLKEFIVNQKEVEPAKELILGPTENNIHIGYGFIAFNNQNIFSRYRLNREDEWHYSSLRSINFYALAAGEYNFEFQYSTDNLHWRPVPQQLAFVIYPPVWQRWYFLAGVSVLILVVVYGYFKMQVLNYRRQQRRLIQAEIKTIEKERSRIAKDLHDSVGTDFTAIKMMVSQLLKKYDEPKSEEIEKQFQGTIQEIQTIIYNLAPPALERYGLQSGLKNYVEKLNTSIPTKIDFDSFGPEVKDPTVSLAAFRIIQELISNTLKHSNADQITLHINSFEDLLNIVYEDNGKGFSWQTSNRGNGLFNIESRVQSLNGKISFDSGEFGVSYAIDIPIKV